MLCISVQGCLQAPAASLTVGEVSVGRASVKPLPSRQTTHGPLLQVKGLEKKASRKAHLERSLGTATSTCLSGPFERAAAAEDRNVLSSLAHSWTTYIATAQVRKLTLLPAPQAWPVVCLATLAKTSDIESSVCRKLPAPPCVNAQVSNIWPESVRHMVETAENAW